MKSTGIEWTTFSSNPLKYRNKAGKTVWACVKTSPGCLRCYAEELGFRYNRGQPFVAANMPELTPFVDDDDLKQIIGAKVVDKIPVDGERMFVGDMTDIFGEWVRDELLDKMFAAFALRPELTVQVLTKRIERANEYFIQANRGNLIYQQVTRWLDAGAKGILGKQWDRVHTLASKKAAGPGRFEWTSWEWPLPNVWLGASVENQHFADVRIPVLLKTPAALRFLSCEPLLGAIEFKQRFADGAYLDYLTGQFHNLQCKGVNGHPDFEVSTEEPRLPKLGWIITGGESGPESRECDIENIRGIVRQCRAAGTPVFVKQCGSNAFIGEGPGRVMLSLADPKGGDPEEWPDDLIAVRNFPKVGVAC